MKDRALKFTKEELRFIRDKAVRGTRLELRDYDWMQLEPKLAGKMRAMLPINPSRRKPPQSVG